MVPINALQPAQPQTQGTPESNVSGSRGSGELSAPSPLQTQALAGLRRRRVFSTMR